MASTTTRRYVPRLLADRGPRRSRSELCGADQLRYFIVEKKDKECVKRLERTKIEEEPDFEGEPQHGLCAADMCTASCDHVAMRTAERRARDRDEIVRQKEALRLKHEMERLALEEAKKRKEERSYA